MTTDIGGAEAVQRIVRLDFTVADLARTQAFYAALGFEALASDAVGDAELAMLGLRGNRARRLLMRLGRQAVGFTQFDPPGRPYPADSTSTDLWFQHIAVAVSAMDEAHRRVREAGALPITRDGPQVLPANTGGVTAFKFRDPDGHPLELLSFPPGVGAAVWQQASGSSPFLGIDHTAIAVGDLDSVRTFYTGLGFSTAERSHNRGVAQRRLDDVADDRVEVVPMKPPTAPPHLELLGYLVGTRRPMPARTRPDDIWATRTWMEVAMLPAGATTLDDGRPACLVHDPEGRAVALLGGSE